jgi:hypothetical protein
MSGDDSQHPLVSDYLQRELLNNYAKEFACFAGKLARRGDLHSCCAQAQLVFVSLDSLRVNPPSDPIVEGENVISFTDSLVNKMKRWFPSSFTAVDESSSPYKYRELYKAVVSLSMDMHRVISRHQTVLQLCLTDYTRSAQTALMSKWPRDFKPIFLMNDCGQNTNKDIMCLAMKAFTISNALQIFISWHDRFGIFGPHKNTLSGLGRILTQLEYLYQAHAHLLAHRRRIPAVDIQPPLSCPLESDEIDEDDEVEDLT